MKIYIESEQKTVTKKNLQGKVIDVLRKLKINPETVIVVLNGELQNEEDILNEEDEIKILSVVSGG